MKLSIIMIVKKINKDFLRILNRDLNFLLKNKNYEVIIIFDSVFKVENLINYKEIKEKTNWKFIFNEKPIGEFESRRFGNFYWRYHLVCRF